MDQVPMNIDQPGTLVAASSSYDFRLPSSLEEAWKGVFGGEELKRGTYKMDDVRMNAWRMVCAAAGRKYYQ